MKTETIKGFKDYTGEEAEKFSVIREVIQRTFEQYNFEQVQTPIIESEEFVRGENPNDEAVSAVYKLTDKGKRKLALRYEFTFQLRRIAKNKKLPYKRFQIGAVFRDEPATGNRLRQFTQCDIDVIGSNAKTEAEVLVVIKEILNKLKIKAVVYVNNRKLLDAILKDILDIKNKEERADFIRVLDKLDKKTFKEVREEIGKKYKGKEGNLSLLLSTLRLNDFKKLKEYYQGVVCVNRGGKYENTLFAEAEKEIRELKDACAMYGLKIVFSPFLARGLSYYNGSVFEIKGDGMKETICGGGSYLVDKTQATGISLCIERLMKITNMIIDIEKMLIVSLGKDRESIKLAEKLRRQGKNVSVFFGKPSKALEYANYYKIKKVIFVGAQEIKKKKFKIKFMKTGRERVLRGV